MPLETGTPQTLIGPDKSWWVPITISPAEMPSLVTLVWAAAGRWVSARALTARPIAFKDLAINDFDIANSSSLARVERRLGPYDPSPFSKIFGADSFLSMTFSENRFPLFRVMLAHATARSRYMA